VEEAPIYLALADFLPLEDDSALGVFLALAFLVDSLGAISIFGTDSTFSSLSLSYPSEASS
jgi:hypothetical protein